MSDTHGSEGRTEQATPRRLEKAREEGQIIRAHSVAGAAVLVAGAFVLLIGGSKLVALLETSLRSGLSLAPEPMREPSRLLEAAGDVLRPGFAALAPFLLLMAAVAFVTDLAIGGWIFTPQPLMPKADRINPISGFGRLFSSDAAAEIVKALVKTAVIGAVAYWLVRARLDRFLHVAAETWPFALQQVAALIANILLVLAVALALVTALEVPYQIWSFRRRLRMSHQDIKDEHRETDGNPQTRRRIRSLRLKLARARMMTEVPKADVVVTNPQHYAAALSYDENRMRAPRLVAKGTGLVALRIRELAAEHGVPIIEAPPLTRAICRYVELGSEIPTGLYGAVAEVLAYVYRLRAARTAGRPSPTAPQDGRFEPPAEFDA
ncbi:MAG TPA: flagellar biosynthesis protein FlhB [Stellaceae bacterium]|nr:flagellar biosynthesis protein FlhB [Stellaceae bacterium]